MNSYPVSFGVAYFIMKTISKDSKMGKYYINKIKQLTEDGHLIPELADVFGTFSDAKMRAYNGCCRTMYDIVDNFNKSKSGENRLIMTPYDWGVVTHNTFGFTFCAILNVHSENYDYSATYYFVKTSQNAYIIQ